MAVVDHFLNGSISDATTDKNRFADVFNPCTGDIAKQVRLATASDVDSAVATAKAAQPDWAALNPQRRARVMYRFKALIEEEMDSLAALLSSEHGKTVADARGDVQRGLDVVEFCCGVPQLLKGESTQGAGPGIDVFSIRAPLGVTVGITPFNFPAMIPLWMLAPAIATGNAFILKPSERTPSVPLRLAQLLSEAGLPDGILQVLNGDRTTVEALIDHADVKAVSFVGSSDIAQAVYARGAALGKRVQAMGGAKNHGIVMPDADMDQAVQDILGAAYGSAGERCMALPVVVPVGERTADELRDRLVAEIPKLRVGVSSDPEADFGPVITAAHRSRIESYIDLAVSEGAELVVDGRGLALQGHENGFFLGPTLLDQVRPDMKSYQDEIFGPVLQIVRADSLEEAISLATYHQYGNGVSIFTRDGGAARQFTDSVEVGMVGVNVPIPVPVSYHSFGGWKRSAFGDHNQYGMDGIRFYTRTKVVTQRWPTAGSSSGGSFVIPTMS